MVRSERAAGFPSCTTGGHPVRPRTPRMAPLRGPRSGFLDERSHRGPRRRGHQRAGLCTISLAQHRTGAPCRSQGTLGRPATGRGPTPRASRPRRGGQQGTSTGSASVMSPMVGGAEAPRPSQAGESWPISSGAVGGAGGHRDIPARRGAVSLRHHHTQVVAGGGALYQQPGSPNEGGRGRCKSLTAPGFSERPQTGSTVLAHRGTRRS